MSILNNSLLLGADAGAAGYEISRSLRFNSSDSAYLSRAVSTAGDRKAFTFACWVKLSSLSTLNQYIFTTSPSNAVDAGYLYYTSNQFVYWDRRQSTDQRILATNAVYRDPSAWYHVVLSVNYSASTSTDRAKIYVNGVEQSYSAATYPNTTDSSYFNAATTHYISAPNGYVDAYLADIHFIDGQALTPSSFTEVSATTGQLIPKAYTGTFTGNSFWLKFADNSAATATTLGKDSSGLGNNWTPNNLSVTAGAGNDSLVDTPTSYGTDTGAGGEVRGNYATFNPLNVQLGAGSLSNGNLDLTGPSGSSAYNYAGGTFGIDTSTSTGWYFEFTQTTYGQFASIGLLDQSVSASALNNLYIIGHSFANQTAGISYSNGGSIGNYGTLTTGLTSWTSSGDVIGVAIKDNKIWFAKNNTWISGSPSAGTSPSITLASTKYVTPAAIGINSSVLSLNAGQRAFTYTAPSGFKCLADTSLPLPVVAKPNTAMDVKLYTGNGSTQTISGLNFSPDFLWIKTRNAAYNHHVYDSVRGVDKFLRTNTTASEFTVSPLDQVTSFNSDGFSLGADNASPGAFEVNELNKTYVAWCFDAGTTTTTNTVGSITSSLRASPSSGFSVVSYTGNGTSGATVGHGLNVAPQLLIVKRRSSAGSTANWAVWHGSLTAGQNLFLNTTDSASAYSPSRFTSTLPTSTVFSVGGGDETNYSGGTFVCYAFSPVTGYSSAFSYSGNGSSDGPMVWLGFRPRFIIQKRTDSAGSWLLIDTARDPVNVARNEMFANSSAAEYDNGSLLDVLSNGFKIRATFANMNASGGSYIGFAFAESPFQYARAR